MARSRNEGGVEGMGTKRGGEFMIYEYRGAANQRIFRITHTSIIIFLSFIG